MKAVLSVSDTTFNIVLILDRFQKLISVLMGILNYFFNCWTKGSRDWIDELNEKRKMRMKFSNFEILYAVEWQVYSFSWSFVFMYSTISW